MCRWWRSFSERVACWARSRRVVAESTIHLTWTHVSGVLRKIGNGTHTFGLALSRHTRARSLLLTEKARFLRTDKRLVVVLISALSTAIVLSISVILYFFKGSDDLERIGAYLTGIGQVIVLVWIIATFYLQMFDLKEQREELSLQRMTLQQQTAIVLYRFEKERLERISRFLVECIYGAAKVDELVRLSLSDPTHSTFTRFIVDDDRTQELIRIKVDEDKDRLVVMYIKSYISGFENLNQLIASVDHRYYIHQTLLSGIPITDLYNLLKVLSSTLKDGDDDIHEG